MSGYLAFAKKEFMENARNGRMLIMLALFLIFGMMSPLSAKFMPQLIAFITPDLQIAIPEPAALDSWVQFYKNISQLGFSIMIILFSSSLSNEYAKGTLVIMLTKGLPRRAVILSKYTAAASVMTVSYWMCFGITYAYTAFLWPGTNLPHTVFAAFALWLVGLMYLSILMLGCAVFRQAFAGVVFLLAVTVVLSLSGAVPLTARYCPMILTSKNTDLLSGAASVSEFAAPAAAALVITAGFLAASAAVFRKKLV